MNRIIYPLLLATILVGCAMMDSRPVANKAPTYPITSIPLAGGRNLTHLAGRPCATYERPEVGVADGERTFSEWKLIGPDCKVLVTAPSFLSDPAFAGEFEEAYRKDDLVSVLESSSGKTIVIVEDRSPNYPRRAYILLTEKADGTWACKELLLKSFVPARKQELGEPDSMGAFYPEYPEILEISDTHLRYSSNNSSIRTAIESVPIKSR